jgi:hypothetical protein
MKFFAEMMNDLPNGHPGCLVATFCYAERMFDSDIHALNRSAVLGWRARFRAALDDVAATYPPSREVDLDALADMFSSTVEGGIVLSKAVGDPAILSQQVMQLRTYIQLLFLPDHR